MKVLVSPSSFGQCGSEPFELLAENGFEAVNNPYCRKLTEDEVIDIASDCVGIVAGVEPLNKKVMDALTGLRCISRVGVGMDSVDLDYARSRGIFVTNTPDGPTRPVAELTIALAMGLLRKVPQAHSNIKNKIWKKEIGSLILDKTVGIFGFGRIGRETAKLFRALGANILAHDLCPDPEYAKKNRVTIVTRDILFSTSDIITVHIPGNADQSPVITRGDFRLMKPSCLLINVARGGVVDEDALFRALDSGAISGAATDVFRNEPYQGKLTELENIILTPHLGSYAKEAKLKMETDAVKNLIDFFKKAG